MVKTCQHLFSKDLSNDELEFWKTFLKGYALEEIRYAFETWHRNGRFFPKPKDIAEHCEAYRLVQANSNFPIGCHRCDWTGFYEVKGTRTPLGKERYAGERVVTQCPCVKSADLREKHPDIQHYGQGYGANDMLWLFKKMQKIYATGDTPNSEALLTELDSRRPDGPPEWRKD